MRTPQELPDFKDFQTPIEVAEYMVSLVPSEAKRILEPTPGLGNIVNALQNIGAEVVAPTDYFLLPKNSRFDSIVMNPPFSSKSALMDNCQHSDLKGMRLGYQILLEGMEMSDSIIALLPWFTISDSDVRLRHLYDFGLISLTALPRKTFQYARIQTCVFELRKGYKGTTEFKVFDRLKATML